MLSLDPTRANIESVLIRAKPYIVAYLKHSKTGNNLKLFCIQSVNLMKVCKS